MSELVTIHRHLIEAQAAHPEASGELSSLLGSIALAAKIISRNVNKAGLLNVLGGTGDVNVQGERVMKLDDLANETLKACLRYNGLVAGIATEEDDDIVVLPSGPASGKYVVFYDPLDGSSNIDANIPIGTIWGIYQRTTPAHDGPVTAADFMQPGSALVASGYAIYGSSTMFVYAAGGVVSGFTLDPEYGEFILSHPNIETPDQCKCYSMNERNSEDWGPGPTALLAAVKSTSPRYQGSTARYVGSLVADVHRNLLYGGIFVYPEDRKSKGGKLRLLYEAIPLAYVVEAAGGTASTGRERILDMVPTHIHQRVPLCIGNSAEVELYERHSTEPT
ncbi:MAG: class 1 fructose-bisphosphatase [Myxococcales bacterium]|nr:class 1 fructose-bisphosphatase [Myxococcales bacterium]